MSSENWQDFEVKCINDACVHACVFVFAEEAEKLDSVMVTLPCLSSGLGIFFFPSPKAVKCSNKFHVRVCVFAL